MSPYQVMYRLLLPGGRVKWVWDQGEAIYDDDGTPLYLEGLMMDVSEQKFQELALQDENRQLKLSVEHVDCLGSIVGKSEAMHKVYSLILKAAETDTNVIIYGETGCGKDIVARAIHNYSGRKGAYGSRELRRHSRESAGERILRFYTRSLYRREYFKGRLCGRGPQRNAFLDEIGELPITLQVKFLRVLETKAYTPLGSNAQKSSSFRLVAATNRDLATLVREKKTRGRFLLTASMCLPSPFRRSESVKKISLCSSRPGVNATGLIFPCRIKCASPCRTTIGPATSGNFTIFWTGMRPSANPWPTFSEKPKPFPSN